VAKKAAVELYDGTNGPLPRFELSQHFFSEPHSFRQLSPRRSTRADLDRLFQLLPAIEVI